ncbi:uncharacterized protein SCHCODRAFT_02607004 [Schizophyllum commune H4-8]|nr:uncharacterized protein SCHCODRAFT_02607004 [Schizophyllum commune H4-8]KAI5900106.1 hypothetical protein SCHCODRAFT_02607004 [Schizophyllum commune H4-8]
MSITTDGCTRDPDLWFDDGNLVIQVTSRLFRVHRGVLAFSSNYFRDMINFPKTQEQDTYEDVPLIALHDDDPRDAAEFLKALYMPYYFPAPPAKTTFETLEGVLRLAHKYDVPALRRCALKHLSTSFPTDLGEISKCQNHPLRPYTYLEVDRLPELMAVASLAHEVHAKWLLPAVFLDTLQFDAVALGSSREWRGRRRYFTHADLVQCFHGRDALHKKIPFSLFISPCVAGPPDHCLLAKTRCFDEDDVVTYHRYPLTYFTEWMVRNSDKPFCQPCQDDMGTKYAQWLDDTWAMLPKVFGLPDWDKLLELKRQDMGLVPVSSSTNKDGVQMNQD